MYHLDNTATIGMSRKVGHLTLERKDNKSNFLCRDALDTLLYYMISVLILNASHYMPIKFMHKFCFLIRFNYLEGLDENSPPASI